MASVNENECRAAGVDPEKVRRLANRIDNAAGELRDMGLHVFGGSGVGSIRADCHGEGAYIVANLYKGNFDGGDGGTHTGPDGLTHGEA